MTDARYPEECIPLTYLVPEQWHLEMVILWDLYPLRLTVQSGKEGYVYIEKKRFVDRMNYIVRADWDLECCFVLPFTLQPSVLKQVGYLFIMQDL